MKVALIPMTDPLVQRAEDAKFKCVFITTNLAIKALTDPGANVSVVPVVGGVIETAPASLT